MRTYQAGEPFPTPCPECQGRRIVAACREAEVARPQTYHTKPLIIIASQSLSRFSTVVCINCGHTTLFATDLQALRRDLEKHPQNFQDATQALRQQLEQG